MEMEKPEKFKPTREQVERALDDMLVGIYMNPTTENVRKLKATLDLYRERTSYLLKEYYEIQKGWEEDLK